jgi:hypothetical protein
VKRCHSAWTSFLVVCLAALGCEGKGPGGDVLSTVPASGTVTFEGTPLESYSVTFQPAVTSGEAHRPATGQTDAAGKFTLGTNAPGDGAPPGKYKVGVAFNPTTTLDSASASPAEIAASMPKEKVKLPLKFRDPQKSGVELEIPAGGSSELKIELK